MSIREFSLQMQFKNTKNIIASIGFLGTIASPAFGIDKTPLKSEPVDAISKLKQAELQNIVQKLKSKYNLTEEELKELNDNIESKIKSKYQTGFGTGVLIGTISFMIFNILSRRKRNDLIKMKILLEDNRNDGNPVVMYKGSEPLDWNPAMEKLTGYSFGEITEMHKRGVDIMELLYGWSPEEFAKVKGALKKGEKYEGEVFTLMSKNGEKHQVAWYTRFVNIGGEIYTIRSGSKDIYNILRSLYQSHSALTESVTDLMGYKDLYTSGHINRVMTYSQIIGKNMGYSEFEMSQLKMKAILHDYGKRDTPDDILKKPGLLTEEERIKINSHTGNGIIKALKNGYEKYTDGMAHHCDFYSPNGDPDLTFDGLLTDIKDGKDVNPTDFNKLLGRNIPEIGRIIAIGDVIDAIGSRRIYSSKSGESIENLINLVATDMLRCSGLIENAGSVTLSEEYWKESSGEESLLIYSIDFNGKNYIPYPDKRIQFDPLILIRNYISGDLCEDIKLAMGGFDKDIIKDKINEFKENITKLKYKQAKYIEKINVIMDVKDSDGKSVQCLETTDPEFSTQDQENLERLEMALEKLINIGNSYQAGENALDTLEDTLS